MFPSLILLPPGASDTVDSYVPMIPDLCLSLADVEEYQYASGRDTAEYVTLAYSVLSAHCGSAHWTEPSWCLRLWHGWSRWVRGARQGNDLRVPLSVRGTNTSVFDRTWKLMTHFIVSWPTTVIGVRSPYPSMEKKYDRRTSRTWWILRSSSHSAVDRC